MGLKMTSESAHPHFHLQPRHSISSAAIATQFASSKTISRLCLQAEGILVACNITADLIRKLRNWPKKESLFWEHRVRRLILAFYLLSLSSSSFRCQLSFPISFVRTSEPRNVYSRLIVRVFREFAQSDLNPALSFEDLGRFARPHISEAQLSMSCKLAVSPCLYACNLRFFTDWQWMNIYAFFGHWWKGSRKKYYMSSNIFLYS